jgi:hypothetical protein
MVIIVRIFKPMPTMKFILNDKLWYLTIALPMRGPKMDQGNVTRSKTAWAFPLCLFGTNSPMAASLRGQLPQQGQMGSCLTQVVDSRRLSL